jgi:hypothetical protein
MEKAILTKAQADALEALKKVQRIGRWEENKIYLVKEKLSEGWESPIFIAANSIPQHDFIKALYVGYEVELTEKEKIEELYRKKGVYTSNSYQNGYTLGMEETLIALGRKDLIPEEAKTRGEN